MKTLQFSTNYRTAAHWLNNSLILCNQITEIDINFWDNCRFDLYNENDEPIEIYQYFLTDCSEGDVEFLENHFGLLFSYSELLDMFVLCVEHYGTSWDYVLCNTDLENAVRNLGE